MRAAVSQRVFSKVGLLGCALFPKRDSLSQQGPLATQKKGTVPFMAGVESEMERLRRENQMLKNRMGKSEL